MLMDGVVPSRTAAVLFAVFLLSGLMLAGSAISGAKEDPRILVIVLAGFLLGGSLVYLAEVAPVSFREVNAGVFASLILATAASDREDWVEEADES